MYAGPDLMNLEDSDLLVRAAAGSRDALAEIARRYVGFVYAAALRQVRDPHLAEDVTQAVFVILARKVGHIRPGTLLHGWLFATTRYAAANAMKMQNRRQFHERRAAAMREQQRRACCDDSHWVEPLLDDALAQLRESDRNAVLLSYMAGKSWREVAASLGTTEEAARKRVTRAVAQLRGMVARRGVATTGAAIAAVLTTSAEASVPPTLLGSVTAALASTTGGAGGAAAAGSASSIIAKGALHMMTWAHVKVAAAGAAVLLGTLGCAGAMVLHQQPTPRPAPATAPASALVPAEIKPGRFTATFQDGVTV